MQRNHAPPRLASKQAIGKAHWWDLALCHLIPDGSVVHLASVTHVFLVKRNTIFTTSHNSGCLGDLRDSHYTVPCHDAVHWGAHIQAHIQAYIQARIRVGLQCCKPIGTPMCSYFAL